MNIEIVQKLLLFIKNENSGTPSELATKLNMSERMIYKYISFLKTEFNAPIKYCRKKKSYRFTENGSIDLLWRE
jgi:predicted transcriptional regulator